MKKAGVWLAALLVCCLCSTPIFAAEGIGQAERTEVLEMLEETADAAKIPCVAAAAVSENRLEYFFVERDDWHGGGLGGDTLFEIGSLSKAFTGFGVLLLVARGQLALDVPITEYIEGFSLLYDGQEVAHTITVADLLYQRSGFTNNKSHYPAAQPGMSLGENIYSLSGRTLAFLPGSRYNYANANYNLLGYIVEQVSGESYASFMRREVFLPLGLENTYADPREALQTGRAVTGARVGLRRAWAYGEAPLEGDVPAGYILSCMDDMARWVQLNLGGDSDLPAQYRLVLARSHEAGTPVAEGSSTSYAAGWFVNAENGEIYHAGGTNAFSSYITMMPSAQKGACVLSNMNASANTADMALNILEVLHGGQATRHSMDIWTVMDWVFTLLLAASVLLVLLLGVTLLRFVRGGKKGKRRALFALPLACLLLLVAVLVVFPLAFQSNWAGIIQWGPFTVLWGLIAFGAYTLLAGFYAVYATRKRG